MHALPLYRAPFMSFDLVFFGGTGDLTWRKLMPALFQAWRHGKLPAQGRILAVARDERTDAGYRQWLQDKLATVDDRAKRPTEDEFERFATQVHYLRMDHQSAPLSRHLRATRRGRPQPPRRARGAGKTPGA